MSACDLHAGQSGAFKETARTVRRPAQEDFRAWNLQNGLSRTIPPPAGFGGFLGAG